MTGGEAGDIIIAGFGLPGRSVAEALGRAGRRYTVIEFNADVAERCSAGGLSIIAGDARDREVLKRAGISTASMLIVAVPDETIALAVVQVARQLNPAIRVIARCTFISGGLKAIQAGANDVVVAEQVVAEHLTRLALAPAQDAARPACTVPANP